MGIFDFLQPKKKKVQGEHELTHKIERHAQHQGEKVHHLKQDLQAQILDVQREIDNKAKADTEYMKANIKFLNEQSKSLRDIAVATGGRERGLKE
jgi:hypothetical protein